MTQETNQEVKKVNIVFRDEEIDIYSEAQHHALDARISVTEYIKQALIEKNLKSRITKIAQSK
ncbi:hypothetical protein [Paraburkholderia fungorum]|jgi:hypothetical protein|uniref:hypothetical protein n=1 Tax=Paraburkholderia fungorum TaxID=134537 RepID=UPI000D04DF20|nr:hypothetical protein [Paraburkholderia fungorum]PRZ45411.1 hypothetical protein BX589_13990 [Paraburkholderia fungorum]